MDLLERVKELCLEKGISQRKMESELGLSNGASSKWSTSSPSGEVLQKVADYFDVTIDYLLGRTAFKNAKELFEHWKLTGRHFAPTYDFGGLLQNERKEKGMSQQEVAKNLNITISDVDDIEEGILPINSELAEKFANILGTTVEQIFDENKFWTTMKEDSSILIKPTTIAAHLPEGVDLTEEEQQQLDDYIKFILSRRKE